MKISQLIDHLRRLKTEHGDLVVQGRSGRPLQADNLELLSKQLQRVDGESSTIRLWAEVWAVKIRPHSPEAREPDYIPLE